jgi:hypothetical protein
MKGWKNRCHSGSVSGVDMLVDARQPMADIHMTPPVMSVTPAMKMAVSAGVIVHMGPPQIV